MLGTFHCKEQKLHLPAVAEMMIVVLMYIAIQRTVNNKYTPCGNIVGPGCAVKLQPTSKCTCLRSMFRKSNQVPKQSTASEIPKMLQLKNCWRFHEFEHCNLQSLFVVFGWQSWMTWFKGHVWGVGDGLNPTPPMQISCLKR
jgi:hypothetical protein